MAFKLPEPSMIEGSPLHKKATFDLLNQYTGGRDSSESEDPFSKGFKSTYDAEKAKENWNKRKTKK